MRVILMTMKELAKLANVSVATVSKAFCDAEDISEETKHHIFEIAKQYGCYGKFYKGKYHKKIIAIICPELASNYYSRFVEDLQRLIEAADCIAVISTDHFSAAQQSELVEYYASYLKVDGIILFDLRSPLKKGYEAPIVSLFSSQDHNVDSVNLDLESAISGAVQVLTGLGHRHIAFLGESLTLQKAKLYQKAMRDAGNPDIHIIQSSSRFEQAGEDGVKQLLSSNREFSAVICAYDNIAFGAIKQLKRAGLRVPGDVSVIGIDNISTSQYTETALTSIDTNPEEICMIAWDLLQKKIKNPYFRSRQNIIIHGNLILRESVAKINGKED